MDSYQTSAGVARLVKGRETLTIAIDTLVISAAVTD